MLKHLFPLTIIILVFSHHQLQGQRRTYSPASRFGIGELTNNYNGQSAGMGQTGIATNSSKYLNSLNPASYSSMDSLSFYFNASINGFSQKISDNTTTSQFSNMLFDGFSFGFPISKKIYTSLGLTTFSKTGYNIQQTVSESLNSFSGSGNVSKVYMGLAAKPAKNLSVGAHLSYLFGNIKNLSYIEYPEDAGALRYGRISEMHVSDAYFDLGIQYNIDLSKDRKFVFGAVYEPRQNINNQYSTFTAQGASITSGNDLIMTGDTIEYLPLKTKNFNMPQGYGLGVSFQIEDKLILAMDYKFQDWSSTKFPDPYTYTTDMQHFSVGAEYIPNDRNNRNYLQRIKYRAGTYYQQNYLQVMGNPNNEFGMSFGLGLPLKRTKSSVNLSCEYGKKGDLTDNGYKENFLRFSLNLTLHEYWFVKQKFD